jgi:hypothetical protein
MTSMWGPLVAVARVFTRWGLIFPLPRQAGLYVYGQSRTPHWVACAHLWCVVGWVCVLHRRPCRAAAALPACAAPACCACRPACCAELAAVYPVFVLCPLVLCRARLFSCAGVGGGSRNRDPHSMSPLGGAGSAFNEPLLALGEGIGLVPCSLCAGGRWSQAAAIRSHVLALEAAAQE